MCTLTFLPLQGNQFLLTSSRDEVYKRKIALPPQMIARSQANILCPIDADAKGTWIATGDNQLTCCLLNGGFEKHERQAPYRKSRGIMVMEIFDHTSASDFLDNYDLDGIEPFTLALVESSGAIRVRELVWDGHQKHIKEIDSKKPYIWSSTTLYNAEMREKRQAWFEEWLAAKHPFLQEEIVGFHQNGGKGEPEFAIKMDRTSGGTVSITSIRYTPPDDISIRYEDVLNQKVGTYPFSKEVYV